MIGKGGNKIKLAEIVLNRAIKAAYMGFIMSRESNEYLEKEYKASKESIKELIDIFNSNTDFAFNRVKIEWDESKWINSIKISAIGRSKLLVKDEIDNFYYEVEKIINSNLKLAVTSNECIQVYDLNTFDLLDRHTWNTMGDKYLASNKKRYMVNFIHLYNIGDYY